MTTLDLNSLDAYIDQRIDAKVNPIINTMLHGWRIVGACEAVGEGVENTSLTLSSEFNIASITPTVSNSSAYTVTFKDPIAPPYIVFASFEAANTAAELYGIHGCTYNGFEFDLNQAKQTNAVFEGIYPSYPTRVSLLVLKKYAEL